MLEIVQDAWKDTLGMAPYLFVVYVFVELIEDRLEGAMKKLITSSKAVGPVLGALCGCVPQCGFSVIATILYTQRVMSLGTLLAVFISTSDEAIPVILSHPEKIGLILPLLLTKIVIATVAGYLVDFIFNHFKHSPVTTEDSVLHAVDLHCCGRDHHKKESIWKSLVLYPLRHTVEICVFIFIVSALINFIVMKAGPAGLGKIFLSHTIFQPVVCALIGMIPNCAASVAITQIFLEGGISFGAAIAGLSAGAGLGMLVLFKENKDKMDTLRVISILLAVSIISGIIIDRMVS